MKREILVNVTPKETRVAIIEDEQLCELLVDREEEERHVGDIFKGVVTAVLPGMQSAFVDIGMEKSGFLHVSDLASSTYHDEDEDEEEEGGNGGAQAGRRRRGGRRRESGPAIQDVLKRGQEIIVQVTKEAISTKGPRLTGQVSPDERHAPGRCVRSRLWRSPWGTGRFQRGVDARSRGRSNPEDPGDRGHLRLTRTASNRSAENGSAA